jgi:hypothetical protein
LEIIAPLLFQAEYVVVRHLNYKVVARAFGVVKRRFCDIKVTGGV